MSHTLLSAILTISLVPVISRDGREEPIIKLDMAVVEADVCNCLNIGKEKAVSRSYISACTGYEDRTVREAIERLRKEKAILTCTDGKGYYIASEDEEGSRAAIEWVTGQNRRAESIRASCRGAQKLISRIQQMEMET